MSLRKGTGLSPFSVNPCSIDWNIVFKFSIIVNDPNGLGVNELEVNKSFSIIENG